MAIIVTMIIDIDHMVHEPSPLLSQGATWDGRQFNVIANDDIILTGGQPTSTFTNLDYYET